MRKRALGRTGIEVSELGFGGWAIGGNEHGNSLGPTDDLTSRAAIQAALEAGVTFFDTADCYGLGKSERLIGEAFASTGRRDSVVIATKAGADFTNPKAVVKRYSLDYLRTALSRSLERLRTDRVDLFQLHDPSLDVIRSQKTHDAVRTIKESGLARAVGVSLHTLEEGEAAIAAGVFETIQVAMNVANQWTANRLLKPACERGMGFIAREPLAQGYLAGKYGPEYVFPNGDVRARWTREQRHYLETFVGRMRGYFHDRRKLSRSLSAIALQFVLAEDAVSTVIVSMKTEAQVAENAGVAALPPLERAHLAWLRE